MTYDVFESPLGLITVSTDGAAITGLHIEGDRYFTHVPADWFQNSREPLLQQAGAELEEYFAGRRRTFDVPLAYDGTPFQRAVWQALSEVPAGSTVSYSDIAARIGRPTATRAVGTAVGRNPICILVPCHRVLASGGGFGGYVAGLDCKRQLLGLEGVTAA
jgi:methylated-DNA-[protein]-cysteine S-methyltransferase